MKDARAQVTFYGVDHPKTLRCECGEQVNSEPGKPIRFPAMAHAEVVHLTTFCRFERAPYVRWSSMSGGPSIHGRRSRTHLGSLVHNGERFSVWISRKTTTHPWDCSVFANNISEPTAPQVTVLEAEFDTLEQARKTASNVILASIGWKQ